MQAVAQRLFSLKRAAQQQSRCSRIVRRADMSWRCVEDSMQGALRILRPRCRRSNCLRRLREISHVFANGASVCCVSLDILPTRAHQDLQSRLRRDEKSLRFGLRIWREPGRCRPARGAGRLRENSSPEASAVHWMRRVRLAAGCRSSTAPANEGCIGSPHHPCALCAHP